MTHIAIIGGGKIGTALAAGLVAGGTPASDITVTNRNPEHGRDIAARLHVKHDTDNAAAAASADVVFVCVKPYAVRDVLSSIVGPAKASGAVVVSMAAGITLSGLEQAVGDNVGVVRVMPNTPMLIGKAVCAVARGRFVTDDQARDVDHLLGLVGEVVHLPDSQMDIATALSGSSPAYLFYVAEAMIDAGVAAGIDRALATKLTAGSLAGAASMLEQSDSSPVELRYDVSSPGGTTVAAIRQLEKLGVKNAFAEAIDACIERSQQMRS